MRVLLVLAVLGLVSPAQAASMHIIDENGKQGIIVEGLIATGDNDEFSRVLESVRDKSSSLVFISGAGGNGITVVLRRHYTSFWHFNSCSRRERLRQRLRFDLDCWRAAYSRQERLHRLPWQCT